MGAGDMKTLLSPQFCCELKLYKIKSILYNLLHNKVFKSLIHRKHFLKKKNLFSKNDGEF